MKRTYPEHDLQRECIKWFDHQYPKYHYLMFHIPNERKQSVIAGARLKSIGQRAGVADLMLAVHKHNEEPLPTIAYHGLFIEMKKPGQKPQQTAEQKAFQKDVESQDYQYALVNSFDQFKKLIDNYLK